MLCVRRWGCGVGSFASPDLSLVGDLEDGFDDYNHTMEDDVYATGLGGRVVSERVRCFARSVSFLRASTPLAAVDAYKRY